MCWHCCQADLWVHSAEQSQINIFYILCFLFNTISTFIYTLFTLTILLRLKNIFWKCKKTCFICIFFYYVWMNDGFMALTLLTLKLMWNTLYFFLLCFEHLLAACWTLTGTSRVAKASNLVKHAEEEQRWRNSLEPRGTRYYEQPTSLQHYRENQQRGEPVIQLYNVHMNIKVESKCQAVHECRGLSTSTCQVCKGLQADPQKTTHIS